MSNDERDPAVQTSFRIGRFTHTVSIAVRRRAIFPDGLFLHTNFAMQSPGINKMVDLDVAATAYGRRDWQTESLTPATPGRDNDLDAGAATHSTRDKDPVPAASAGTRRDRGLEFTLTACVGRNAGQATASAWSGGDGTCPRAADALRDGDDNGR